MGNERKIEHSNEARSAGHDVQPAKVSLTIRELTTARYLFIEIFVNLKIILDNEV